VRGSISYSTTLEPLGRIHSHCFVIFSYYHITVIAFTLNYPFYHSHTHLTHTHTHTHTHFLPFPSYHVTPLPPNLISCLITCYLCSLFDFDLMGDEQYGAPVKGSMDESRRYCDVLCCIAFYSTALLSTLLYSNVLRCISLHYTALYCTALHRHRHLLYHLALILSATLPCSTSP
jgi:hypothetical protein